jgi:hypothetical protein
MTNEFSGVAGCKINIQISVAFLCTNRKLFVKDINNKITFTIATKNP